MQDNGCAKRKHSNSKKEEVKEKALFVSENSRDK